jgi:translation initiation factor eIF-2B subunit beta
MWAAYLLMHNLKVLQSNLFAFTRHNVSISRRGCLPEHSVGNTVRKVLHHIREEYNTATRGTAAASTAQSFSIAKFVLLGQPRQHTMAPKSEKEGRGTLKENDPDDPDSFARGLKPVLMEAIQDVLDELETVYDNVSKNAKDHIHSE